LILVAEQIKKRIRKEIGEWLNVLSGLLLIDLWQKLAAGIKKPDGLIVIDHTNLIDTYKILNLMDFADNVRYKARLNINGIFTAMDFYNASCQKLKKKFSEVLMGDIGTNAFADGKLMIMI